MAKLLDVAFILPGTNIRYGIDGIIRLIPVVGDLIASAFSLWLVREARALGAPWHVTARMLGQCRAGRRGRDGAGRGRRVRRDVPRQYAQHAAAAALDGQAAALALRSAIAVSTNLSKERACTFVRDVNYAASASALSLAGAGSGARGRRGSGKSWLSYSVRMPL